MSGIDELFQRLAGGPSAETIDRLAKMVDAHWDEAKALSKATSTLVGDKDGLYQKVVRDEAFKTARGLLAAQVLTFIHPISAEALLVSAFTDGTIGFTIAYLQQHYNITPKEPVQES